jgi:linoleoyl-CoA desaturase
MDKPWADHQLHTTANFARKNKLLNWYVGGLNYQIEHHLFPNICHIHYPAISQIVEQTAREFNLPYHCFDNLSGAYFSHIRTLYALGKP